MRRYLASVGSRFVHEERGQVLFFLATGCLLILLAIAALVVDFGQAAQKQRQLQAAADAAALAGSQRLDDPTVAKATAQSYGATAGNANAVADLAGSGATETATTACASAGCVMDDSVVVSESGSVPTAFGKLIGVNSIDVRVKAAACGPCHTKPLDVVILLDRTRSMCTDDAGNAQYPSCPDLTYAKAGIQTFLSFMDPTKDRVALALTPPPPNLANPCSTPATDWPNDLWNEMGWYPAATDSNYIVVPLAQGVGFKNADGSLNTASKLVSTINCVQAGGSTAYALALQKAQDELAANGRPDAQKIIVFMSDGGANTASLSQYPDHSSVATNPPVGHSWNEYTAVVQPCHAAINVAAGIKAAGTTIYTVGYDVAASTGAAYTKDMQCYEAIHGLKPDGWSILVPFVGNGNGAEVAESPTIAAKDALKAIATPPSAPTAPENYFEKPTAGDVRPIFMKLAIQIGQSRLIPIPAGS